MRSRDSPFAAKVAWHRNKSVLAKSSWSAHRNKVCTWQKFLVRAVRATDFRRGAATVARLGASRPVQRDGGHAVYIGVAPIPHLVIYSCGARARIGWRRW